MNYMKNKKGQGSDTFKLLIAAVVAMVILGIVTGVFQNIWNLVGGITCVSSPIDEMVTKIKKAESGITTSTGAMCMYTGETFTAASLTSKVTNVQSISFRCGSGNAAAVCKSGTGLIEVSGDSISAKGDAKFKALIGCTGSGDYTCNIDILSV